MPQKVSVHFLEKKLNGVFSPLYLGQPVCIHNAWPLLSYLSQKNLFERNGRYITRDVVCNISGSLGPGRNAQDTQLSLPQHLRSVWRLYIMLGIIGYLILSRDFMYIMQAVSWIICVGCTISKRSTRNKYCIIQLAFVLSFYF